MLSEYNDDDSITVVGTDKNMSELKKASLYFWPAVDIYEDTKYCGVGKDVHNCIRNILVQRLLFGIEDLEALCHSSETIRSARWYISRYALRLTPLMAATAKQTQSQWDPAGGWYS